MLALDTMVDENLFICPRCASPVRSAGGPWRCTKASCRYAKEAFPTVSGVPALVDFEHSVLDADRLQASQAASPVRRSKLSRVLNRLVHPANSTARAAVARMWSSSEPTLPRAAAARILVIGGGTQGDGLAELVRRSESRSDRLRHLRQPLGSIRRRRPCDPAGRRLRRWLLSRRASSKCWSALRWRRKDPSRLRSGGIVVHAELPFLHRCARALRLRRFFMPTAAIGTCFRDFECRIRLRLRGRCRHGFALVARPFCAGPDPLDSARQNHVALLFLASCADRILDPRHSLDAASSVFFLGRKSAVPITEAQIIDYYQGGM